MFLFGVVMALLGAVLPVISARLGIDMAQAGNLFLTMNMAMLAASLSLGPLTDRFGLKFTLTGGPLLVLAALAGLAMATSARDLIVSMAALGFGGGALNLGSNTLVADLHDDPMEKNAALTRLGIYFGFGALLIPLQIAALLESLGLTTILSSACVLCAAASLFTAALSFPPAKQRHRAAFADVARLAAMPLVLAFGLMLFFQSGNEFTLGGYLSTFLVREAGASVSAASYVLAGYWASIMLARVLLGRLLLKVPGHHVILACAAIAAAGALLASTTSSIATATPAVLLMGFGVAGIFPAALGLAGTHFKEQSGTVFGILFTMALAGGMTLPWSVGHLAAQSGTRVALQVAAAAFVAIFAIELASARLRQHAVVR